MRRAAHRAVASRRLWPAVALSALAPGICLAAAPTSVNQGGDQAAELRLVAITGDRLSGFVLPIDPIAGSITLSAGHAWVWQVDDTQRIELREDVRITLGSYSFSSSAAEVWLNR